MEISNTKLPGVLLIKPKLFRDNRGHFLETFHSQRYAGDAFPEGFVQDNVSFSTKNVLRGLHYQLGKPQGKLVMALQGEIFDVAVDIRVGSPTFGNWEGFILSSDDYRQLYIPEGFAHGFCVKSHTATVLYKCTELYTPSEERGIRWDDRSLSIDWPVSDLILSDKDRAYPTLNEISYEALPTLRSNR